MFQKRRSRFVRGKSFLCDEDSFELLLTFDDVKPLALPDVQIAQWSCTQMALGFADRLGVTGIRDTGSTASACMAFKARRDGLQVHFVVPYASGDFVTEDVELAGELLSLHLRRLCSGIESQCKFL